MTDETISTEMENESISVEQHEADSKYDDKYIEKLKASDLKWRRRAKENEDAMKKFEDAEKRLKDTETKSELVMKQVAEMRSLADKRLIDAEIKAVATELGLKKLEYYKLADLNKIKISDNGDVNGVRDMLIELKSQDPDLFKLPTTTNVSFAPSEIKEVRSDNLADVKNLSDFSKAKSDFLRSLEH